MWTTALGWAGSLLKTLAQLVGDLFRYVAVFMAYRLGIRKERQNQVEKRLEQDNEAAKTLRNIASDDAERDRLRDKFVR